MSVNDLTFCSFEARSALVATAFALFLAGCGTAPVPQGINDPNEADNRQIHEFNRSIDRALLKPASGAYHTLVPAPVEEGISNLTRHLDAPGDILNGLLQGRPHHALENTARFVVNTIVGFGGIADPATAFGIDGKPTDFGETLHVWGAGEGKFVEFPFVGPTTERDLIGTVVDLAINPLRQILPRREGTVATAFKLGSRLGDRARYSNTIDSILYDSADSYAQARLLYLQNRRHELGQTTGAAGDDSFLDPYEDPYGE